MVKLICVALATFVALTIVLFLFVPPYLYLDGLKGVPDDRIPAAGASIPDAAARVYWRLLGGEGEPDISSMNPWGVVLWIAVDVSRGNLTRLEQADFRLTSAAARSLMFRTDFDHKENTWHLSNLSAAIWVSRHWTAREAVATVLQEAYFWNGFVGIDAAASGYFGRTPSGLSDAELVFLLSMVFAPGPSGPWCDADGFRARFDALAQRAGYDVDYDSLALIQPTTLYCP